MKITKRDVFWYYADRLDRARRLELEAAARTDPAVRKWFDDLAPTDDEPAAEWIELVPAAGAAVPSEPPPVDTLVVLEGGLVLRTVPPLAADGPTDESIPWDACPLVRPDYRKGVLTVHQSFDAVPDGRVDLVVVRVRDGAAQIVHHRKGHQLKRERDFWYDSVALEQLRPESRKTGDEFVYVVRSVRTGTTSAEGVRE